MLAGIQHLGSPSSCARSGRHRPPVAMTMMAFCYNLKRLAFLLERGFDAFFKPVATEARGARNG